MNHKPPSPRNIKIPTQIKIGGLSYKITRLKEGSFHDKKLDQININGNLSNQQAQVALWHEIIHAMNCEIENETIVEFLAHAISAVLIDNNLLR